MQIREVPVLILISNCCRSVYTETGPKHVQKHEMLAANCPSSGKIRSQTLKFLSWHMQYIWHWSLSTHCTTKMVRACLANGDMRLLWTAHARYSIIRWTMQALQGRLEDHTDGLQHHSHRIWVACSTENFMTINVQERSPKLRARRVLDL